MKYRFKIQPLFFSFILLCACNPEEPVEGSEGRTLTEDDLTSNQVVDLYFFQGDRLIGVRDNGRPEAALERQEAFPINEFLTLELPGTDPASSPTMVFLESEYVFDRNYYTYPKALMAITVGETLYAYNMPSGTLQWQLNLGGSVTGSLISDRFAINGRNRPENPEILGYVGTLNGQFHAVDMRTGTIKWTYNTESGLGFAGSAKIERDNNFNLVIVGSEDGFVYAFDAETGVLEWRYDTGAAVQGQPVRTVVQGVAYAATINIAGVVTVHGLNNGTHIMSTQLPTTTQASLTAYKIPDRLNYSLAVGGLNGIIYSLNARNGQIEWEYDTGSPIFSSIKSGFRFTADPWGVTSRGNLYVANEGGKVMALNKNGGLVWDLELNKGPIYSSPLLTPTRDFERNLGVAIHIQTLESIVGIEAATGTIYSEYSLPDAGGETNNGLSSPYGVMVDRQTRDWSSYPVTIEPSESGMIAD